MSRPARATAAPGAAAPLHELARPAGAGTAPPGQGGRSAPAPQKEEEVNEFDNVVERFGTDSAKWDTLRRSHGDRALALSVADMDFPAPAAVVDAVTERARQGVYGYTDLPEDHAPAFAGWLERRHGWRIDPAHLIACHRVVQAVAVMVRIWTEPGDAVLVHSPGYAPTADTVVRNGRRLIRSPLVRTGEGPGARWEMDFDGMERALREERVRAVLLYSPHNPTGRVWTPEELRRLGELCVRHGALLISDDVHADFSGTGYLAAGRPHTFAASLSPEIARATVTFVSPMKTFNLAGLEITGVVVPDDRLRTELAEGLRAAGEHNPSFFAAVALKAAYTHGADWLDGLLAHLTDNLALTRSVLEERLPALRLTEPEGTYLAWIDCRAWSTDEDRLRRWITDEQGVAVSWGSSFGPGNEGFLRLNLATPRPLLTEALERLATAYALHPPGADGPEADGPEADGPGAAPATGTAHGEQP